LNHTLPSEKQLANNSGNGLSAMSTVTETFMYFVSIEICGCCASLFAASTCAGNSEHNAHSAIATIDFALGPKSIM